MANQRSFRGKIARANSLQHLNSHRSFIWELQQFLEPFNFPFFMDRFIGTVRFHCWSMAGIRASLEELEIDIQEPDIFHLKLTVKNAENIITKKYVVAIADILTWPIDIEPMLKSSRLNIGLLLPSEEPAIIDFLQEEAVWQMRGERYTPLVNLHSHYQQDNLNFQPWFKYHFALRLSPSDRPVGFISLTQISQPWLITPLISPISYEPVMLSYGLSPSYWGQGLMSEALAVCVPWFIGDRNVREIIAFAQVNNHGSRRLLQKLGLEECGILDNPQISADLQEAYQFIIHKKRA